MTYEHRQVQQYFDAYGDREWHRLTRRPSDEVSAFIHGHYLAQFVRPGQRVLEIGAGPGRFTIMLAELGAVITVTDLSAVQLELNAHHVAQAGHASAVEARWQLDVTDLSGVPAAAFDHVVCYGGVLSYVADQAPRAVREMLRVVRPGGHVLVSVMSRLHNLRKHKVLSRLPQLASVHGLPALSDLMLGRHAELPCTDALPFRLYTAAEVRHLFGAHGAGVVAWSAVNCLSANNDDHLAELRQCPELWQQFLAWELELGGQEGALETGHHLLAVARREALLSGDGPP